MSVTATSSLEAMIMAERKTATTVEDVREQTAMALMASGPGLFDALENIDLEERAEAILCLADYAGLPPQLAIELLIDPRSVKNAILGNPRLTALMLAATSAARTRMGDPSTFVDNLQEDLARLKAKEAE